MLRRKAVIIGFLSAASASLNEANFWMTFSMGALYPFGWGYVAAGSMGFRVFCRRKGAAGSSSEGKRGGPADAGHDVEHGDSRGEAEAKPRGRASQAVGAASGEPVGRAQKKDSLIVTAAAKRRKARVGRSTIWPGARSQGPPLLPWRQAR